MVKTLIDCTPAENGKGKYFRFIGGKKICSCTGRESALFYIGSRQLEILSNSYSLWITQGAWCHSQIPLHV